MVLVVTLKTIFFRMLDLYTYRIGTYFGCCMGRFKRWRKHWTCDIPSLKLIASIFIRQKPLCLFKSPARFNQLENVVYSTLDRGFIRFQTKQARERDYKSSLDKTPFNQSQSFSYVGIFAIYE